MGKSHEMMNKIILIGNRIKKTNNKYIFLIIIKVNKYF